jgi:hypothetical protein
MLLSNRLLLIPLWVIRVQMLDMLLLCTVTTVKYQSTVLYVSRIVLIFFRLVHVILFIKLLAARHSDKISIPKSVIINHWIRVVPCALHINEAAKIYNGITRCQLASSSNIDINIHNTIYNPSKHHFRFPSYSPKNPAVDWITVVFENCCSVALWRYPLKLCFYSCVAQFMCLRSRGD